MTDARKLEDLIFKACGKDFTSLALRVFRFQHEHCEVYRAFADALSVDPASVTSLEDIPFLPIEFFKTHEVVCRGKQGLRVFHSSGTTGTVPSRHFIDPGIYEASLLKGFRLAYGDPAGYTFLALTPGPDENPYSSLIFMIRVLMEQDPGHDRGFYLNEPAGLMKRLNASSGREKIVLFGLSWALLDFAERYPGDYSGLTVIETGGMKGRRKEITREELHAGLRTGLRGSSIRSEYGMTELLSQAWSGPGGLFTCPGWMKVLIRELNDPFAYISCGKTGCINVIDLANLYSCSFIATDDLGKLSEDGRFQVLGRLDASELRGCSLMIGD